MEGFIEHDTEPYGSIKGEEFAFQGLCSAESVIMTFLAQFNSN